MAWGGGVQLITLILFSILKFGAVLFFKRWFIFLNRHVETLPQKPEAWQSQQPVNNPKSPCLLDVVRNLFFEGVP